MKYELKVLWGNLDTALYDLSKYTYIVGHTTLHFNLYGYQRIFVSNNNVSLRDGFSYSDLFFIGSSMELLI